MSLAERRALIIKDMVEDEENFAKGTVSGGLLEFFKWLDQDTDLFDKVMVEVTIESGGSLHLDEADMKELINGYLMVSK